LTRLFSIELGKKPIEIISISKSCQTLLSTVVPSCILQLRTERRNIDKLAKLLEVLDEYLKEENCKRTPALLLNDFETGE
jgi:hypothetical protein